jgi:hypothetical protein
MITLYGYRSSPCAAKVRAVLADMAIARDSKPESACVKLPFLIVIFDTMPAS